MRPNANNGWHCTPLLPIALFLNFVKYKHITHDSYTITSILCINYLAVIISWFYIKKLYSFNYFTFLMIISAIFAHITNNSRSSEYFIIMYVFCFLSNVTLTLCIKRMPLIYKSSFTFGELTMVMMGSLSYVSSAIGCVFSYSFNSKYESSFCSSNISTEVMQFCMTAIFAVIIFSSALRKNKLLTFVSLMIIVLMTYLFLYNFLRHEPILWLIDYTLYNRSHAQLITQWFIMFLIAIVFAIIMVTFSSRNSYRLTIIRKFFHLAITVVYLIGLKYNSDFLSFVSAGLLALFAILEALRIIELPIIGPFLDTGVRYFRDEKDIGILTLTHMYLLVGCSMPLWIFPFSNRHNLSVASGLITIGFGDTAASIGGRLFGKHHWKGSNKTYEGTFFAIVAQCLSSVIIYNYLMSKNIGFFDNESIILYLISIVTAIIEGKTTQIDNLTLPLYYYILVNVLL